jgi:Protein of unknown function (DUF3102)
MAPAKKRKNARTLSEIADAIHLLERTNIIDIGDCLIEAKDQECEHGEWLNWLVDAELGYSVDTAERYMKVAKLGAKYATLRNLKLGKTTLYALADHEPEEDLPAIIKELAKHATKTSLKPSAAERVIRIGIGRGRFGDHPDATLVALAVESIRSMCLSSHTSLLRYEKVVAALQEREPKTDEDAKSIINEIEQAALDPEEREYQESLRRSGDARRAAAAAPKDAVATPEKKDRLYSVIADEKIADIALQQGDHIFSRIETFLSFDASDPLWSVAKAKLIERGLKAEELYRLDKLIEMLQAIRDALRENSGASAVKAAADRAEAKAKLLH